MGRLNYSDVAVQNVPTAAATDSSTKAASTAFVQSVVPAGVVFPYAGSAAPTNFLMCDGSTVSRTTYAALFAAIGTTYGAGDGSTTFKLPDLRGQFIRGLDQGAGVDTGRALGSSQTDAFKAHAHQTVNVKGVSGDTIGGHFNGEGAGTITSGLTGQNFSGTAYNAALTDAPGGTETRPKNVALNHIIKAY